MTTIALDAFGNVACDSRECAGSVIVDDNCEKHEKIGDVHFWFAGRSADQDLLIQAVTGNPQDSYDENVSSVALVYSDGQFYTAGISKDEGYYIQAERPGNPVALGSGSGHALTAMDLGLGAKDAVKYAMKRDMQTGGKIRTFKLS